MPQVFNTLDPYASSLVAAFVADFAVQFVAYVLSAALQTEKLFDLSGCVSFLASVLVSALLRPDGDRLAPRQIIAAALLAVWSLRLGLFLFQRVLSRPDKRFDELKSSPVKYAGVFVMQSVWVFLCPLPVWIVLALYGPEQRAIQWSDIVGIAIWVAGFAIEAIADVQKSAFKSKHPDAFMSSGLFRYSRYANYFGEVTLWCGMFVLCASGFTSGVQWISIISPVFVYCLIAFVSGIPMLEKSSSQKYGQLPEYQDYVARTSKFFLWLPKKQAATPVP
ncbi:uncharacterized protein BJ171DRAFT_558169 [Polychytrium aggregatum]|uniref:uncharacterized protein n=1 Tax=Polychytrium aggregatum TaxID=110093 RepID=UPI0022FF2447|nr:uncharacterized protein BJ171DRAFT_558169 [Polychytrium aggregatum]KAI9206606.1 hypothetical protein BJ171DRAFT_558169 [Polychytrium aggregatum]